MMSTLELQAKKAELAKGILNLESEDIINELSRVFNKLVVKYPCMHTSEDIKGGAKQAIQDYKSGKGISHENMKKRHLA